MGLIKQDFQRGLIIREDLWNAIAPYSQILKMGIANPVKENFVRRKQL